MLIGLTGSYCSGKDTVAEYLVKKRKFIHYSLSDVLREEMRTRGIKITRENLIRFGTDLRKKHGNSILAKKVLLKCPKEENCVITSIRHQAEVMELRKRNDFFMINVDAPAKMRFARMVKRNREEDPKTFEKFLEFEKKESQTKGPGQQVSRCMEMADITIQNDSKTTKYLFRKINLLLLKLQKGNIGKRSKKNES